MEPVAPALPPLQSYRFETPFGPIFYKSETPTPRVLMIHGFRRSPANLYPWRRRIPGLGFIHLPGHGGASELVNRSAPVWIAAIAELTTFLEAPPILAESLGAIVAMGVPARAVVAVEPPLSTHQLWPIQETARLLRLQGLDIREELEALFHAPFHWILDRIRAPTLVLAGDIPLLPPRALDYTPSVLTDADFAAFARHPLVEAHRLPGGHALLDENPDGVTAAAAGFMSRHGFL